MRSWFCTVLVLSALAPVYAQTPDPAYPVLEKAYKSLNAQDYDGAIAGFEEAVTLAPDRAVIHKQLAYTLLKIGGTEAARDQFVQAMRLDPRDDQVALEYAFLCYETKQPVAARRAFDRLARAGNATAKEAFENIDRPLREGMERWQKAVQIDPGNFSVHEELARLAEQRDDLKLASEHYEKAWRLRPERRELLLDLGRVWKQVDREEDANAALIAAWRGGTPWVSDEARELLPPRYPYLAEFERALALDPTNWQLVDDVAFQKGGPTTPKTLQTRSVRSPTPENPKTLGEKSLEKGYLGDALKYLQIAHENDPQDYAVMLKLGWAFNLLKDDREALHWFDLARSSPDPATAEEASKAYRKLAPEFALLRTTVWAFPVFSTRWHDVFGYAQAKTELHLRWLPVRPYVSMRLLGDLKGTLDAGIGAQYLSERSVIFAAGLATGPWHGTTGWFEAGEALMYREAAGQTRRTMPDYRGGVSFTKGFGHLIGSESHGAFAETNDDGIFVSRFSDDSFLYSQNRGGYTLGNTQILWNANVTADAQRQYWANFIETGPGLRFRLTGMPFLFSVNALRGAYLFNQFNPRRPNYNEVRVGVWYAFTR
jgi:Tfp pilus assembly protein PilF